MSICKLCLEKRALRNSHIIPEFLYSPLYNEKRYMMGINGLGNRGWRPLQKGITEKLFCDACEQHFNKHHEIPFHRQWIDQQAAPNPWPSCPQDLVVVHVDYATFKLFHLSILFRASVSTHANFSDVKLGPHENQIREMLVANNPGASWQYPILGRALIKPVTRELVHEIITRPINVRFEGESLLQHRVWRCVLVDRRLFALKPRLVAIVLDRSRRSAACGNSVYRSGRSSCSIKSLTENERLTLRSG